MTRKLFITFIIILFTWGCGQNTASEHGEGEHSHTHSHSHTPKASEKMHNTMKGNDNQQTNAEKISVPKEEKTKEILDAYLQLKNALANDNREAAAEASKNLLTALNSFDKGDTELSEILSDAQEQAEHIIKSEIEHQREHLYPLSEDIRDLALKLGTDRTLYVTFCPMANDENGAIWISETQEIKNPFFGKQMSNCGEVQKIITYAEQ